MYRNRIPLFRRSTERCMAFAELNIDILTRSKARGGYSASSNTALLMLLIFIGSLLSE